MVDIAQPPSIPEKRIASNFDWRPYIELDEKIKPEKRQALEQALDILAKYHPSFPDTLKRACSPHIMEQRQNMLNAMNSFGKNVPYHDDGEIPKLKITAKEGFLSINSYDPFNRTVNINFKQSGKVRFWNRDGVPYASTLLEILEHEIGHAADRKVYNYHEADSRSTNSIRGTLRQVFAPLTYLFSTIKQREKSNEKYIETPLITQSNANLINAFEAPGRLDYDVKVPRKGILGWLGFKEKFSPYSNPQPIPSHLRKSGPVQIAPELSTDTAFPLPILSAQSVEEIRNPVTAETIAEDLKKAPLFNPAVITLAGTVETLGNGLLAGPAIYVAEKVINSVKAQKHLKGTKEK